MIIEKQPFEYLSPSNNVSGGVTGVTTIIRFSMLKTHIPLNEKNKKGVHRIRFQRLDFQFIAINWNHQFQAAGFAGPPLTSYTPPKTNMEHMEPKNGSLKQEIPIGKHHFQVLCEILGE